MFPKIYIKFIFGEKFLGHAVQSCMCPNGKVMEHRSSRGRSNLSNPHSHRPKEDIEAKKKHFC